MGMRIIIEDSSAPGVEVTRSREAATPAPSEPLAASDAGPPPEHLLSAYGGGEEMESLEREEGRGKKAAGMEQPLGSGMDGIDAGGPDMSLAELIQTLETAAGRESNGHA